MFECDKCGVCCRNLHQSKLLSQLDRGDGVCRYLEGNLCSIYLERPMLCRVDECYEIFFQNIMTKEEYYQINYKSCQLLKQRLKER